MQNEQPPALRFESLKAPVPAIEAVKQSVIFPRTKIAAVLGGMVALLYFSIVVLAIVTGGWDLLFTFVGVFVLVPAVIGLWWFWNAYNSAVQRMRLKLFAADNSFDFEPSSLASNEPGAIFSMGESQSFEHVVSGKYLGLPFEFGNFFYMTGGKNRRKRWYGVLRVTLSRRVPHVLLDGKHNNYLRISNFPQFKNRQKLQLEGDFNKYFDLYVPHGYERDALYFITPELMALLVDHGAKFDIELVDNYLYIYSDKPFDLDHATAIQSIFDLIPQIGGEVEANTKRYADANVGNRTANIVAEPGRRLKKTFSWITIVFIIVWLIFFFWPEN